MKRIIADKVSKKFRIGFRTHEGMLARVLSVFSGRERKKEIEVLKEVSFSVDKSEILGLIGKNTSGKSTLLRIIAGIYEKDAGKIKTIGKLIPIINLNVGLREKLSMRDNIYLCCSLFGLSKTSITKRIGSIMEFAELEKFIDTKVYQFSEGMKQRLAFSIAIHCNPDILLLDEVFEVGDEKFRSKSAEKIKEIAKQGGSVILVSHDLEMIRKHCDRVILMNKGEIIGNGEPKKIIEKYLSYKERL